jgi:hypothetical protein
MDPVTYERDGPVAVIALSSGETAGGAARFAAGEGRGGRFERS